VELLEVELQRKHFTSHGQHLNVSGKDLVCLELIKTIKLLQNKARTTPIQMLWRDDNLNDGNQETQSKDVNPVGLCISKNCTKSINNYVDFSKHEDRIKLSVRPKKVPVTRSKDFFMVSHAAKKKFTLENKNIMKVLHQNIRGLRTKYNELLCRLQEKSPHCSMSH
jgi:hypothetical protein